MVTWCLLHGHVVLQLQARLHAVQGEVTNVSQRLQCASTPELRAQSPASEDEGELTDRLDELKAEFTQLLTEVRRRRSLLGEPGTSPVFEVRKPAVSSVACNLSRIYLITNFQIIAVRREIAISFPFFIEFINLFRGELHFIRIYRD